MELEIIKKIDSTRISNEDKPKNLDEFICKICTFILHDPHECENCGIPYCKDCLEKWKFHSNQCPLKCNPQMKIKPAHRFIKKMLGDLKIKCENEECAVIIELSRLDYHLKECEYFMVKCPNEDCEEKITRKELLKHKDSCKFNTFQCERCGEKFRNFLDEEFGVSSPGDIHTTQDCIKSLSINLKNLSEKFNNVWVKNESNEKLLKELKEKTNLLMCNVSYKCGSGHSLFFRATWNSTCSTCSRSDICTRWECLECELYYCLSCIRIVSPVYCPNSHTYLYGQNVEFECDLCHLEKFGGPLSIHDNVCNFDICESCTQVLFPNNK